MRVGIIGGGAAGLATAWLLDQTHDVVLLESAVMSEIKIAERLAPGSARLRRLFGEVGEADRPAPGGPGAVDRLPSAG